MRRGAVSVASTIVRCTDEEARPTTRGSFGWPGALFEVDTQLNFVARLGLISRGKFDEIEWKCKECGRILAGLIRSIEEKLGAAEQVTDA